MRAKLEKDPDQVALSEAGSTKQGEVPQEILTYN